MGNRTVRKFRVSLNGSRFFYTSLEPLENRAVTPL